MVPKWGSMYFARYCGVHPRELNRILHPLGEAPAPSLDETPAAVFRVRPRLISAWSFGVYATRTDWRFYSEK